MLVTLSGLGAALGVAVTGAIFNELLTQRTIGLAGRVGVELTRSTAQRVDGVLAGTPGARHLVQQLADGRGGRLEHAVHEAFVTALGTALKVSAGLVVFGLVLALALLRRAPRADEAPGAPVLGVPTPRPAPRLALAARKDREPARDGG